MMGQARRKGITIAVVSQTPLVRFTRHVRPTENDGVVRLSALSPEDWSFTAGGVTRMLKPLLRTWMNQGFARRVEWVSLQGGVSPAVELDGYRLSFVHLTSEERSGYVRAKEALWSLLNDLPEAPDDPGDVPAAAWRSYETYAARTAARLNTAQGRRGPFDAVYVHDFQLLPVARFLPRQVPTIFHLHTPFPANLSAGWRRFIVNALNAYDSVIVSSREYARALRNAGYQGPLHCVYPFVDPVEYPRAAPSDVDAFRSEFGIGPQDRVVLNVARMDPMKSQDRLIEALPRLLELEPRTRLVLVGNGSFSSSRTGGLGLSKGQRWRAHLEDLAKDLGVSDRVTFTGHLNEDRIPAAFGAADAFSLPSVREGFGLAAIESWLYGVPAVVSDGAGVRELVRDGENGYVVDTADANAHAEALAELLNAPPDQRAVYAEVGREAAEKATLASGRIVLQDLVTEVSALPEARP